MKGYEQKVTQPENWLTDMAENDRQFVKVIRLPLGEEWAECTDEEKVQWEEEHQAPEVAANAAPDPVAEEGLGV